MEDKKDLSAYHTAKVDTSSNTTNNQINNNNINNSKRPHEHHQQHLAKTPQQLTLGGTVNAAAAPQTRCRARLALESFDALQACGCRQTSKFVTAGTA
jgi:hypothetical protein